MANYDLGGGSAVVTGGGAGIGRSCALELAANGAAVVVADILDDKAEQVANEITATGGIARPYTVDVTDFTGVQGMVAAAREMAPLRIAVNNAGVGDAGVPVADIGLDDWRKVIEVNLNGVFYCMKAEIPAMLAAGGGSIVNMASVLSSLGFETRSTYVTAKHGIVGLTKTAALEYSRHGIRVNAVGPGFIKTPLLAANLEQGVIDYLGTQHAVERMGVPEEVAALVTFLASGDASFVTGSYQLVDGGYAAQ